MKVETKLQDNLFDSFSCIVEQSVNNEINVEFTKEEFESLCKLIKSNNKNNVVQLKFIKK